MMAPAFATAHVGDLFSPAQAPTPRRLEFANLPVSQRPCAAVGLISYRCKSAFGWIMIGATDKADAMREALRSSDRVHPDHLEVWNGKQYVPAHNKQAEARV